MSASEAAARRAYRSPRRQQQAVETRTLVLAAATRLFADRGWAATGMRDVAREAGVSVETVYAGFRSKSDLLMAAIDVAVVGDTEPVPLSQRAEFAALGRGTRQERIRVAARLMTEIHRRTAGVNVALREAAASDPELDRQMREREENRRSNIEEGMSLVTERQVSPEQCDALWAVLDVGNFRLLTELRGWTPEQYETWLADVIDRLLEDRPRAGEPRSTPRR
jgi:AcrR family transcriptional regulator